MNTQSRADIEDLLTSKVAIVAPHMDDEIIGCGGLMLLHRDKSRLHCIFATDGARSPLPLLPWQGSPPPNLTQIRAREADDVLSFVGVPPSNRTRLDLPDGSLAGHGGRLRDLLEVKLREIEPDFVFVPFRYDLHSDHVAVYRAVRDLKNAGRLRAEVFEYLVYYRWRLIEGGDIRSLIRPERLFTLDTAAVADRKREAIRRYVSQTQKLFDWQESPILSDESMDSRCREPEQFLSSDPGEAQLSCFTAHKPRVLASHYLERFGKRRKDQVLATAKWLTARLTRTAS